MKRNALLSLVLAAFLLLTTGLTATAVAQPANPDGGPPPQAGPPQDVIDDLLARGFDQIIPSVFQRPDDSGSFDTVAFGVDGHKWLLLQLESKLGVYLDLQAKDFRSERVESVTALEDLIERTKQLIRDTNRQQLKATGLRAIRLDDGDALSGLAGAVAACSTTIDRQAAAARGTSGPTANGSSSFTDCQDYGETFIHTYAEGLDGGLFTGMTQDCFDNGIGGSTCAASSSVTATSGCFSDAYAQVLISTANNGPVTWSVSESNFLCRAISATLTGPTSVYVPAFGSAFATWSVSASGGTGAFSYQWTYNGLVVGSGTSYTRTYNHPGFGGISLDKVAVKVTDSSGEAVTQIRNVSVTYEDTCSDPCLCPLLSLQPDPSGITNLAGAQQIQPCF